MLNLYLIRHGKAVNFQDDNTDFKRSLNKKGTAQVNQLGYVLSKKGGNNDLLIIASGAFRTRETAEILNHYLKKKSVTFDNEFYLAEKFTILKKLISLANAKNIVFVGHNNGISDLASYLTGKNILLSTSEMAHLRFNVNEWDEISAETGELVEVFKPDVLAF